MPAKPLDEVIEPKRAHKAREISILNEFDLKVSRSQDLPRPEVSFPWLVEQGDVTVKHKLKIGSSYLDALLDGGIGRGYVTDFYGERNSGKSQLCFQLALNNSASEKTTLFIDMLGSFRPERIRQIAENRKLDAKKILNRIFVLRCLTVDQQISIHERVREFLDERQASLMIIDDITNNFLASETETTNIELRSLFVKHLHEISHLAVEHSLFMAITNSVRAKPEMQGTKSTRETFSQAIARSVAERIRLENIGRYILASKNGRTARFLITESGVHD